MAADTKKEPLRVKQYDTNSRQARITLKMGGEPWTIPFGCQIHINVRKTDGTLADAACTRIDEHTVLTPITEQMTAVTGTQLGELYFLGSDGDIKSQSFPVVVYEAVMDQARMESSDDFQSLQDALRDVKASTDTADIAAQYATEQGNSARDAARQAENAAGSIQAAVDAAAAAKVSETNAKTSETASAQTKQEVTDYVEAQKAAFVGYSKRESDSRYANALTNSVTGEGGVTVEDAWTAPVLGLDVVGKSEQATTTGAQLLPQPQFNDTKNGITVKTQMDGGISITGTATSAIAFTVAEILLPAGTYILSGLSGLVVGRMYFQLVEISAQGGQFVGELAKVGPVAGATVTIDRDVWARAEIKVLSGVTADSICYPMLNAGDTALPWEPYTGGAPSPSPDYPQDIISTGTVTPSEVAALKPMLNAGDTALPWEPYTGGKPSPSVEYPQEVKVTATGGNLFNASKIKTMSAWGATVTNNGDGSITVSGSGVLTDYINQAILFTRDQTLTILGAGNYCMSGKKTYPYFYFTLYDTVEKKVVFEINTKATPSKEITQKLINNENVVLRIGFYGEANTQIIPGVVCPMVNAGDSALPWAPYQSTSATITLTEPLRGIGEYRDRIMCRDGVWGIERWITKLTLDGSEDWVIYGNSSYISFYTQSVCLPVSMNKREGLCEQLRVMTIGGKNLNTIWLGANNKVVYAIDNQFYNDTLEDKGLANWKAHLAESPLEIITYLDAPTWEPLPAATQQALNALTTYAGTTHLTITAGGPAPEVTLEYVQDTQKAIEQHDTANRQYTDNQIAAIVAALPTATQAAIVDNQTTKLLQEV
nr:MAG TPA: BppU domain protein [Caudoviricetes sp.]